jgi:hypothetical protein
VVIGGDNKVKGFNDFKNISHSIEVYKSKYIGYVIMEEVDTSINKVLDSEMIDLFNMLISEDREDGGIYLDKFPEVFKEIIKRNYTSDFRSLDSYDIFNIINLLSKKNYILLKEVLHKYFELDPIIYELIDVLYNISKYYNWEDIHSGQFGLNSKGELVAFDIANDDEKFGNSFDYYPTPKNILKESNSRELPIDIKKSFINFINTDFKEDNIKLSSDETTLINNECWLMYIDDLFPDGDSHYIIKNKKTFSEALFPAMNGDSDTVNEYYYYDGKGKDKGFTEFTEISYDYWEDLEEYDTYSAALEETYDVLMQFNYEDYLKIDKKTINLFNDINESKRILKFNGFISSRP